MKRLCITLIIVILSAAGLCSCATSSIFPVLGDELAGVSGMVIDPASGRLYVVNANSKVAYNYDQGSFQVYDVSDPLNFTLLGTAHTLSFSGKVSIDTTRKLAYVPNRFSQTDSQVNDRMYVFNIDEASPDFLTYSEVATGRDPFGIACCYPADRLWMAEGGRDSVYKVQYVDKPDLSIGDVNMVVSLSNGATLDPDATTDLAIVGQMAFFSRTNGGIVVVNMDEVGVEGAEPVDYWISDIRTPRGITTDGTYIYVVSEEDETGEWVPWVFVIDPSTLVPLTDNTAAQILDKNDDGLLVASISLNKRRDPQEVLVTDDYILVTAGWNNDNFVEVANRSDFSWNTEIATGVEPFAMALYQVGGVDAYVYVANQIDNTIQVIDLNTLSIVATYP